MQTGSKRAVAKASARTTVQVLIATVLVVLAEKAPVLQDLNSEVLLAAAVGLVVAGQQTLEHRFPRVAVALGNSGPIFLAVLEQFREGNLDADEEPGTIVIPEEELEDVR